MKDLLIVGAGPAGLTAAIYGKRAGFDTAVFEQAGISGGQVLTTYEVDNYPALPGIDGFELGTKFREHAEAAGAEFIDEKVVKILDGMDYKVVVTENAEYKARAVIVATGAAHSHLNVPGEEELSGMGVSYCATCDGAFFKDKVAAVIGGGDVAVEDAIFLSRICRKVYLIHRRKELRAAKSLQDKLFDLSNVEMVWDSVVEQILGDGQVEGVSLKDVNTQEVRRLDVDGVFVAIGIHPNSEMFAGLLEMDERGYILAKEDGKTNVDGIFATGDVRTKKQRQIITAAADGANAVYSVEEYFQNIG